MLNIPPANNAADLIESRVDERAKAWAKKAVEHAKKTNHHPLTVIFHSAFKNKGGAV